MNDNTNHYLPENRLDDNNPKQIHIENLFTTFVCLGPVARTCLKAVSPYTDRQKYQTVFKAYLRKVDSNIRQVAGRYKFGSLSGAVECFDTHRIILMNPSEDNIGYEPEIITRWIACRVAKCAEIGAKEQGYNLFLSLSQQSPLRTSAGWLFESYTHDWLRKGGPFEADRLPYQASDNPFLFNIKPGTEVRYYANLAHLAEQLKNRRGGKGVEPGMRGTYFQPWCRTQESFDSVMVTTVQRKETLVLFQITMAITHDIKVGGVREILQALPKTIKQVFIIFVIPADRVDNYKVPQKAPADCDLTNGQYKYTIRQHRVVFPDDALRSIAVPKPGGR